MWPYFVATVSSLLWASIKVTAPGVAPIAPDSRPTTYPNGGDRRFVRVLSDARFARRVRVAVFGDDKTC